ncbi:hypothetical protein HNY73_016145 [Argiope bruennichi]|uniref:Uncharacterized protein n=1 Tax=Argiope bruennichi TaxID=94029 RepID=A0A8T0ELA9_ARGBR|nr:hypothetical protein HNY73_016145 [Argiope bruennichi]
MGFLQGCNTSKCHDLELRREMENIGYVPTTEEQLNKLCPPALKAVQCATETIQGCVGRPLTELSTSDNKTVAGFAHGVVSTGNLIIDICTPGTDFRDSYLANVVCFKELVTDPEATIKCHQQGMNVYNSYKQSRDALSNEITDEDEERESCMVTAYRLACFASKLHDKCGENARKTFVDTLKKFQYLKWSDCTEAHIHNLKTEFLESLQLEEQRKNIFSSVFESKKRRK